MGKKSSNKKGEAPTVAKAPWDHGTGTALASKLTIVEDAKFRDPETGKQVNPNGVKRKRRQSLVERYMQRGLISEMQYLSARDLQAAHQPEPQDGEGVKVDCVKDPTEAMATLLDRQGDFRRMRASVDPILWPLVELVVLQEIPITATGRRGVAATIAMSRLRSGLDQISSYLKRH